MTPMEDDHDDDEDQLDGEEDDGAGQKKIRVLSVLLLFPRPLSVGSCC